MAGAPSARRSHRDSATSRAMRRCCRCRSWTVPHGTGDILQRDMSGVFVHGTLAQEAWDRGRSRRHGGTGRLCGQR